MNVPSAAPRRVAPVRRQSPLLWIAIAVVAIALLVRLFAPHENRYETTVRAFTAAVQNNDLAGVQKLENSETAAETTRGRLGHAADVFAPLGAIKAVKEVPTTDTTPRVHEFDVTFQKGSVHEKMQFDPQDKIFRFAYDPPVTGK